MKTSRRSAELSYGRGYYMAADSSVVYGCSDLCCSLCVFEWDPFVPDPSHPVSCISRLESFWGSEVMAPSPYRWCQMSLVGLPPTTLINTMAHDGWPQLKLRSSHSSRHVGGWKSGSFASLLIFVLITRAASRCVFFLSLCNQSIKMMHRQNVKPSLLNVYVFHQRTFDPS